MISGMKAYLSYYMYLVIWLIVLNLVDLVVLDWIITGLMGAPIWGIEHQLSSTSIVQLRSFGFHFKEVFLNPGFYLVSLLVPLVLLIIHVGFGKLGKRLLKKGLSTDSM